jgi:Asp-tRNA(Asn)/Glu-tRNA(Gln) amidotransferase A subunit family amidase
MNTVERTDSQGETPSTASGPAPTRRFVLGALAGLGVGSVTFRRALAADAVRTGTVTPEMILQAEWVAGIKLSEEDRKAIAGGLTRTVSDLEVLRAVKLPNDVPPALTFLPAPWQMPSAGQARGTVTPQVSAVPKKPDNGDDLAFQPVTALAALLRTRQVSSSELTRIYLDRLRKYDPALFCVVSLTEDLALKQAERADKEIAAGRYRGPLHGIPWGAKDLIAHPGYKTTWGAKPFKDQTIEVQATVARRLEDAGAVLVAKLTLGALAMGDKWFGGRTANPWDAAQGSSGSSAGSAAASAGGLVGFALGTETLGSIVSPCTRCGATGLRPTFGRVSRHGCMALAWSMDKVGPIARSVEDCALVFGTVHGADGLDPAAVERPFSWPRQAQLNTLRVGYIENGTDPKDREELRVLRDLGLKPVAVKLPDKYPLAPLRHILDAEAAAAFDELMRQGVTEGLNDWPGLMRQAMFMSAVDYIRANRIRTLVMREMETVMSGLDAYVGIGGRDLLLTNLTGHPSVVLPNGFGKEGEVEHPTSLTFTGKIYGETDLLTVANAYQQATGFHLRHPPMDRLTGGKPPAGK